MIPQFAKPTAKWTTGLNTFSGSLQFSLAKTGVRDRKMLLTTEPIEL